MTGPAVVLLSDEDVARVAQVKALVDVEALIARLDDPSWAVRREIVFALAELGDDATGALCAALVGRRDLESRIAALVDALSASRGNPDAALMTLTQSKDPAVVCDAVHILGRRHCLSALELLSSLVEHVDDNVAVAAIEALGRVGGPASVERLLAVLESGNFFRVFPAIDVVGLMADFRATGPLVKLTRQALYTLEATRALGRIGDVRAIPALVALLASPDDLLVRTAASALWGIHQKRSEGLPNVAAQAPAWWTSGEPDEAAGRVIAAASGAAEADHAAMCHVLGWLGTKDAIAALLGFMSIAGEVGLAARAALALLGDLINTELIASLHDGDSATRALLLPLIGRAPARPVVERCLADPSPAVRAAACAALARLGDPAAVTALFDLLASGGPLESYAAVNAILSLGSLETERRALAAARSSNPDERRGAVRIVATFGYERGLPELLAAIEDDDERLRDIALPGLALLESAAALDALIAAATHPSPRTRSRAVRALAQAAADSRVDSVLCDALLDSDPWVRYYACHALGHRKVVGAIEALGLRLDDEAGQVRIAAVEALSHLPGAVAMQALRVAAAANDPDIRRAALVGLGLRAEAEGLPTLLEAASASDPATRLVALSALSALPRLEAFEALVSATHDSDEGVRHAAIGLVGTVPGRTATLALVSLLLVRASRPQALLALGRRVSGRVPALLEALDEADATRAGPLAAVVSRMPEAADAFAVALGSKNVIARRAVASVLGSLPVTKARAALVQRASIDPDLEVRRLAAGTLEL